MIQEDSIILIKGEDKTDKIDLCRYDNIKQLFLIKFNGSAKTYYYKDVEILNEYVEIPISEDMVVYHNGFPFNNVTHIKDYGPIMEVYFSIGKSNRFYTSKIEVKQTGVINEIPLKVLDYWRIIANLIKTDKRQGIHGDFIYNEFKKLKFVHPESVLSVYINHELIQKNLHQETTNIFPFSYNLSQKIALDQALQSTISIIEGPPGTGKTQTILNILANLVVMQNKKVAVVSGNNAAVQNVWEKLESKGYHFLAAKLGNKEIREEFFSELPNYDVLNWESDISDQVLLSKIEELDIQISRLMEIDREIAQLKQHRTAYVLEQDHFESYFDKKNAIEIRKMSLYKQTPDRILELLKDNILAVKKGEENKLLYKFKLFFKHGFISFKKLKNQEMDVILNIQRQFYELRIKEIQEQISDKEQQLRKQSYQKLIEEHQSCSEKLFKHKLYTKYHKIHKISLEEKNYKLKQNFKSFIDSYPIVLSTTHSLRNCIPNNYLLDYCIIDESSQVDLLTAALALSCCKRVIIVGDTKQLPHIVPAHIESIVGSTTEKGINESYNYFKHNVLSSMLSLYSDDLPKVILKEHYRCHPQIIEFCNLKYYDGELLTYTEQQEDDNPLLIWRTTHGNHMREGINIGKHNQRELDVIQHEILQNIVKTSDKYTDIGFVTPYREQVKKASEQLDKDIESDTIHKYQGREKPIMIMSTVLDKTARGRKGINFVNDPCKINVAVSRAQQQFVLVTGNDVFKEYGNEIGDLIRYMEYSTLDNNILESEIVSVFDLMYQEYADKLRSFKKYASSFNESKIPSENLMEALLSQILMESKYKQLRLGRQVALMNLFNNLDQLNEEEKKYIKHSASVDFVIYHKLDKAPILAIEVDGFAYHENNPTQLERDKKKESIFKKMKLDLHRFKTNGSQEEERIREILNFIISEG